MKRTVFRAALLAAVLLLLCAAVFAAPDVSVSGNTLQIRNAAEGYAAAYNADGKMTAAKEIRGGSAELDTGGENAACFKVFHVNAAMQPQSPCLDAIALTGDCTTKDLCPAGGEPAQKDIYVFGTLTADEGFKISEEQTLHVAEGAKLIIRDRTYVEIRGTLALDGTVELQNGGLAINFDTFRFEHGQNARIVQNGTLYITGEQYEMIRDCLEVRTSEETEIGIMRPFAEPTFCKIHYTEPLTISCREPHFTVEDRDGWGGRLEFRDCVFDAPITIVRNDEYWFDVDFTDSCTVNGGVRVIDAEDNERTDCHPSIYGAKGLSVTGEAAVLVKTTDGNAFTLEGANVTCWGNQKDDGSDESFAKINYWDDGTRVIELRVAPEGGMRASSEAAISENFRLSNRIDWGGLTVAEGFFIERDANRCDAAWRLFDRFRESLTETKYTPSADWDEIDSESQERFAWALANGVMDTDEENRLRPYDDLFCGDLRQMLQNIADQLEPAAPEGLAWFLGDEGPLADGERIISTGETREVRGDELDDRLDEFRRFFIRTSVEVSTAQELVQAMENGEINEIFITDDIPLTADDPFTPDENGFIHLQNAWEWRDIHVVPGKTLTLTEGTHLCVDDRVCLRLDREEPTQSKLVLEKESFIELKGGIDADWENQIIFGENADIHTYCHCIDVAKRTLEVLGGRIEIPALTPTEQATYPTYRDWPEDEYDRNALICLIKFCDFKPEPDGDGYRWTGYDRTDYQQTCAIIRAFFAEVSEEELIIGLEDFEPDWWVDWYALEDLMQQLSAQLSIMVDSETTEFCITDETPRFEISRVRFTNPITVRCDPSCSDFDAGSVNFFDCEFAAGITLERYPDHAYFADLASCTAAWLCVPESDEENDPEASGSVRCCPPTLPENVSAEIKAKYFSFARAEGETLTANGIAAVVDHMESENEDATFNRNHPGSLVVYTSAGAHMTVTGTMQEDLYVAGNADVSGVNANGHTILLEIDPGAGISTVCEIGTQDVTVNSFGEFRLTGENSEQVRFTDEADEAVVYWNGVLLPRALQDDETEEIFLRDDEGWFVANKRFVNHVTIFCDPDSQKPADVPVAMPRFENCVFTKGLTLLRDPGHLYTVVLPTCTVNGQIEIKESDPANDPTADGFVGVIASNGATVVAQAHASVTAEPGSSFTLNGVTLTGTLGANANGSFEAEYCVSRKTDLSLTASVRLWTTGSAAFSQVAGTLTDDLIIGGNADISQLTTGERYVGLTCGENERIRCTLGANKRAQMLTAGIYDLYGEDCGWLLFPEDATVYWNGSKRPLPLYVSWTEFSNTIDQEVKRVYINAFPTPEDFKDWRTAAQEMSKVYPKILDGTELDISK